MPAVARLHMKELFRDPGFTRAAFFQGPRENEGIATFIRNEDSSGRAPAGYAAGPILPS